MIHDAETWREAVRAHVQAAWDALDRAQITLYHRYEDTCDEELASFKERFEEASDALILLAIDELYPLDDDAG